MRRCDKIVIDCIALGFESLKVNYGIMFDASPTEFLRWTRVYLIVAIIATMDINDAETLSSNECRLFTKLIVHFFSLHFQSFKFIASINIRIRLRSTLPNKTYIYERNTNKYENIQTCSFVIRKECVNNTSFCSITILKIKSALRLRNNRHTQHTHSLVYLCINCVQPKADAKIPLEAHVKICMQSHNNRWFLK